MVLSPADLHRIPQEGTWLGLRWMAGTHPDRGRQKGVPGDEVWCTKAVGPGGAVTAAGLEAAVAARMATQPEELPSRTVQPVPWASRLGGCAWPVMGAQEGSGCGPREALRSEP